MNKLPDETTKTHGQIKPESRYKCFLKISPIHVIHAKQEGKKKSHRSRNTIAMKHLQNLICLRTHTGFSEQHLRAMQARQPSQDQVRDVNGPVSTEMEGK